MALEKEALTHKIEDDLALRNRNWDKIETQLVQKANKTDVANLTSAKPTFVASIEEMTSPNTVYVNTTDGYIYLYNSSSSSFENVNVLYQSTGLGTNSVGLDNIKDDEFILNYVTKDTSNNLPVASAEPNEVRLNERGNIYFSNGNMIDIIGMTDGTYIEDGVTVVIEGNKIKVTGTPSVNKYFKLSGGSGFVPNNAGLDARDYTLPLANAYTFGLYDVINTLGGLFTVLVRSSVSGNYLQVIPTMTSPYKEGNDQSLFGAVYMFFEANYENETEFKVFLSPTTYNIENVVTPNTNIYTNVLKARSQAKYILSDKTGVAKPLVRMTDIVGGGGETENLKSIYVEGHDDFFYFYIKGSKKDSNKYLRYTFGYWDGIGFNNGKGWVLGQVHAVEKINGIWQTLFPVVTTGEWEMALRITGRPDFIGCKQHGSEISFYDRFYVDGVRWTPNNSSFYCEEIKVVEKLTMYDPADETTVVGTHRKVYTISNKEINIKQRIDWSDSLTMGKDSYIAMLPIVRGNDIMTPFQITAKAFNDDTYEEIDVSNGSHSGRTELHEPNKWTLYSDSTGISASVENKLKVKTSGAYSFIQNTVDRYNKVYFSYCGDNYPVAIGDVWENEIVYKLNISS